MSATVVSGMRPTGRLHLGHYHGVLKNWLRLQEQHESFFFVADLHALTTHYERPEGIRQSTWDLLVEWLAVGLDPEKATLFVQSWVPQHAELALLLGMLTPLSWLERVPTFKDQQEQLRDRDLATFGFLGYPALMSADILLYDAASVPVGADQVAHLEICRELARRFNNLYGRSPADSEAIEAGLRALGKRGKQQYQRLQERFQQDGDGSVIAQARELLDSAASINEATRALLLANLEGKGRTILIEPQPLLTEAAKMPGLDGRKMSKSYGNAIALREEPETVRKKLLTMPTDPARVGRHDPGEPQRCPVWPLHQIYSSEATRTWVQEGCRSASIGCVDCKSALVDKVLAEQEPIRARAEEWAAQPQRLREIAAHGAEKARTRAEQTLIRVREVMGLDAG
ncbi:tryptophan--tRNA ligase [Acidithiobacillus sp. AMEEHan]|uniref:tryptophan--tRNA ligase n=1 Tax=Acidithiobacillus sp. AMEEHan TaxID=2994951 RepID=UPI0027E53640|nr:tryptophan--tRNA ligase [Acidithiobacillus sp. AMEEHan]